MNKWKRTSASLPRHSQREMRDTHAGGGCRKCGHPNPAKISFFGPLDSPQMSFFEVPVGTSGCMHWIDLTLLVPNIW